MLIQQSTIASLKVELQMLQISSQELQRSIELEKVQKINTEKLAQQLSKENDELKAKLDESMSMRRELEEAIAVASRSHPPSSQNDQETVMTLREVVSKTLHSKHLVNSSLMTGSR